MLESVLNKKVVIIIKLKKYIIPTTVLSLLIVLIAVLSYDSQLVSAITREDIDDLKQIKVDLREKDIEINEFLNDNKDETIKFEAVLVELKAELKQIKKDATTSWESLKLITEKEDEIIQGEINVKDSKRNRIDLLNEKSDILVKLRALDLEIEDSKIELKSEEFFLNSTKLDISQLKKAIGIKLSNSCIASININATASKCPTYEMLAELDSSIEKVSGNFTKEGGYFHRDESPYKNSWRWYDLDDTPRIFVDPPSGMSERISMITLESNFGIYFLAEDGLLENGIRSYNEGRYIDNCRNTILDTNNWLKTLPLTIHMMRTGCPNLDELDKKYIFRNATEIDVGSSSNWQYNEWVKNSKLNCKTICKEY